MCKEHTFQTECHVLKICICDFILFFCINLGRYLMPRSPQVMPVMVHYPPLSPSRLQRQTTLPHSSHLYRSPKSDPMCPCTLSTDECEHAEEHCRLAPSPRSLNEIATVSANTNRARRPEDPNPATMFSEFAFRQAMVQAAEPIQVQVVLSASHSAWAFVLRTRPFCPQCCLWPSTASTA